MEWGIPTQGPTSQTQMQRHPPPLIIVKWGGGGWRIIVKQFFVNNNSLVLQLLFFFGGGKGDVDSSFEEGGVREILTCLDACCWCCDCGHENLRFAAGASGPCTCIRGSLIHVAFHIEAWKSLFANIRLCKSKHCRVLRAVSFVQIEALQIPAMWRMQKLHF